MSKKVLLLANLGSPDSFAVKDVRKYLREFLMDGRVIDIPKVPRYLLVNGIIAPFRAPRSAKKYKSIWTQEGSPLIVLSEKLRARVEEKTGLPAYLSMRYGNPTPQASLSEIQEYQPNAEEVVLFPLYPHYAMSSYETAVEYVKEVWEKGNYAFQLKIVDPYYNHPDYIQALSNSIKPFLREEFDHLLFSYHGVPERHILKGDITGNHCLKSTDCCRTPSPAHKFCYRHQVFETTRLVIEQLNLNDEEYSVSFQSRLGSDKWLGPATSDVLAQLPGKGVKKILVVTPAFVSDCLETIEEIGMEGRETFLEAGGEKFTAIPCLNLSDEWVEAIGKMV
ncbi:ferrochelatase [Marinilabilia rubra]|uniref:Ferrochelatase n=1 Tax=Marinilabilia rubra TaxID=2162893 RepID=A0A2U2BCC8_9BACT|nr:ferrochelatase [Marinilabilia rubra]PWE00687.1 ferrochelatase [Marinilabilia rubra]